MADFLLIAEAILEVDAKARGRLYPSRIKFSIRRIENVMRDGYVGTADSASALKSSITASEAVPEPPWQCGCRGVDQLPG